MKHLKPLTVSLKLKNKNNRKNSILSGLPRMRRSNLCIRDGCGTHISFWDENRGTHLNRAPGIMGSVFLPADAAHSVLKRLRRANFLLEEMKQGNIQRECREEVCTYEEAREAFENDEKTRRFWEEYVRESNPSGGLEAVVGGVNSLYLILPLLLLLLLIAAVAITVWRCHSRKHSERSPALGHSHRDPGLSVVSMDQWGRDYHHPEHLELSIHSSPAYPGSELTPGRRSATDPPPSYEEAVGHTDVHIETEPPPQYDDIVNTSSVIGHGK